MKKSDLQVLLIVLGIAFAVLSWNFIYNANNDKAEAIKVENETVLQPEVDKLEALDANKEQYIAETEKMDEDSVDIIAKFPADCLTEDEIMYYNNMETTNKNQIAIPTVSMEEVAEIPYTGTTTVEEYELTDDGIKMYEKSTSVSFSTTYNGFKNVVNYIYNVQGRKSINSVSLSPSGDGHLMGSMEVDFYYLNGTDKVYEPENIPAIPLGRNNIFGVLEGNSEAVAEEEAAE